MSGWHVVGCSECDGLWILDGADRRDQETVQCRHCGQEHRADRLRSIKQHDTQTGAAEIRARIMAVRAGEIDDYEDEPTYGEMADRVDGQIDRRRSSEHLELSSPRWSLFENSAEDALDQRSQLFENAAEESLGWTDEALADEAEAYLYDRDLPLAQTLDEHLDAWQEECEQDLIDERTGELVLDDQFPADTVASISISEGATVARAGSDRGLWARSLEQEAVQKLLVDGIKRFARSRSDADLFGCLEARDVSADLRGAILAVARAETEDALSRAMYGGDGQKGLVYLARRLGTQRASREDIFTAARLIGWADRTFDVDRATISVRLEDGFREQAADQREAVMTLLDELARNSEVVFVGSPVDLRWCQVAHDSPAEFSERWTGRGTTDPIGERVERAVAELDRDSTGTRILREIYEAPNERVSYNQLTSALRISKSAISQWFGTRDPDLESLGMVDRYDLDRRKYVELTPSGREAVETIDAETPRQQRLDAIFSGSSQSPDHGREDTRERVGGEEEDPRRKGSGLAPVGELDRAHAVGATATAESRGLSLVDYPHAEVEDYRCADLWVDQDADRCVVSAEYVNPLQYWVSTARALTHHRLFTFELTPERLESEEHDFWNLFDEHRQILRSSRCLGHLPDDVEDAEAFIEGLQDAREHLEDLTRKLYRGDFEDEDRFRGEITRDALGLCGTMVHLLDLVDVDVVREVRIPDFSRNFDEDRIEDLCQTLAVGAAIQSRYGQFTAYRQLFEQRPEKLEWSIDAEIDADNPAGELIGSFVVAGNFGDTDGSKTQGFVDDLRDALADPASTRDDAPEFQVPIPVRAFEFDRQHFSEAVFRMCQAKRLDPSREAVSLLRLFVGTPYDAAAAIHRLRREGISRDLRISEVQQALSGIDTDRLLPQATPAGRRIVAALLGADEPLSTTDLEAAADVSRTSITGSSTSSRAGDRLQTLGLLELTDDGEWRLALPFNDDEERYDDHRVPWVVAEAETLEVRDVLSDLVFDTLPPGHAAQRCWYTLRDDGLPDLSRLLEHAPWLADWVPVLEDVLDTISVLSVDDPGRVDEVAFGPEPTQESIQTAVTEAPADD